jgi:glycosyltransferase involved in cell wall biosynthesis
MRFSLIVATVGRVSELAVLLETLLNQSFTNFEVILIDQNDDDRIGPVVERFSNGLKMLRLRSAVRNNSHARNLGLAQASGDIIAFPDDDCLYPPDALGKVDAAFARDGKLAFLTGPALAYEGHLGPGRWHKSSGWIDVFTVWTCITEFNFFVLADWSRKVGGFDEAFGLGARFGSAEGIDMVLRIMRAGGRGYYDFELRIVHPDKGLVPFTVSRAFQYGTGLGQALRKHDAPARVIAMFFVRPIGGTFINFLRFRSIAASYHWQTLRGRLHGFFTKAV